MLLSFCRGHTDRLPTVPLLLLARVLNPLPSFVLLPFVAQQSAQVLSVPLSSAMLSLMPLSNKLKESSGAFAFRSSPQQLQRFKVTADLHDLPSAGDLVAIDCEFVALSEEDTFISAEGRRVVHRGAQLGAFGTVSLVGVRGVVLLCTLLSACTWYGSRPCPDGKSGKRGGLGFTIAGILLNVLLLLVVCVHTHCGSARCYSAWHLVVPACLLVLVVCPSVSVGVQGLDACRAWTVAFRRRFVGERVASTNTRQQRPRSLVFLVPQIMFCC